MYNIQALSNAIISKNVARNRNYLAFKEHLLTLLNGGEWDYNIPYPPCQEKTYIFCLFINVSCELWCCCLSESGFSPINRNPRNGTGRIQNWSEDIGQVAGASVYLVCRSYDSAVAALFAYRCFLRNLLNSVQLETAPTGPDN